MFSNKIKFLSWTLIFSLGKVLNVTTFMHNALFSRVVKANKSVGELTCILRFYDRIANWARVLDEMLFNAKLDPRAHAQCLFIVCHAFLLFSFSYRVLQNKLFVKCYKLQLQWRFCILFYSCFRKICFS